MRSGSPATTFESNVQTGCNYSQIGPFKQGLGGHQSTDGGATWTSHLAWQGAFDATTKIGDNADKIFSTITVDSSHQVHIALSVRHNDDRWASSRSARSTTGTVRRKPQPTDLYLVTSPDNGVHWRCVPVNKTTGSFFFPCSLRVGRDRRRVLLQLDDAAAQQSEQRVVRRHLPGHRGCGDLHERRPRDVHLPPAATDEILLDPKPDSRQRLKRGGICTFGIFCSAVPGANRGLADVFEVQRRSRRRRECSLGTKDLGAKERSTSRAELGGERPCWGARPQRLLWPRRTCRSRSPTAPPIRVGPGQRLTLYLTVTNNGVSSGPSTTSGVRRTS